MSPAERTAGPRQSRLLHVPNSQLFPQHSLGYKPETVTHHSALHAGESWQRHGPMVISIWPTTCPWIQSWEKSPGFVQQNGKQKGSYLEKCQQDPSPEPLHSLGKFLPVFRELTDTLPPCPALLLCGCHGPALQSARPTPCGPAERQPAAHLPALSHQTLRWKQMQTYLPTLPHRLLLAPPMLGCPWLLSPRSPPLQAFPIPGPGPCRPG